MVTAVRTAAHNAMMLCDPRALPAKDTTRVQVAAEPFKTGGIVRKYCPKSLVHFVMPFCGGYPAVIETLADYAPTVTGYFRSPVKTTRSSAGHGTVCDRETFRPEADVRTASIGF
jgi:hypothetical protein